MADIQEEDHPQEAEEEATTEEEQEDQIILVKVANVMVLGDHPSSTPI